jgi:hypothetical protein
MAVSETAAFDRGVRPLLEEVVSGKAEVILKFSPEPALIQRIDELAAKSTEGQLSPDEREEYAGYVRANKFVAMLQRMTRDLARSAE